MGQRVGVRARTKALSFFILKLHQHDAAPALAPVQTQFYIVNKSKIDIKFLIFSLFRTRNRGLNWSQNRSYIMLAQLRHEKLQDFGSGSDPHPLAYTNRKFITNLICFHHKGQRIGAGIAARS
jgi:hypothetical protein